MKVLCLVHVSTLCIFSNYKSLLDFENQIFNISILLIEKNKDLSMCIASFYFNEIFVFIIQHLQSIDATIRAPLPPSSELRIYANENLCVDVSVKNSFEYITVLFNHF